MSLFDKSISEYPQVDGPLSNKCYLSALDKCYQLFCKKASKKGRKETTLSEFDALLFHTPYCKLVKKSVARLALNDFLRLPLDEVKILLISHRRSRITATLINFPLSGLTRPSHPLLTLPLKAPTVTKLSRELLWKRLQTPSERRPRRA